MSRLLSIADKVLSLVESMGMAVAFVAFVGMVLVTAIDVVLRYVFNNPLSWDYPVITNYVVIVLYCMALAGAQKMRSNIGIELVLRRLPPRLREAINCAAFLVVIAFCLLIVSTGWDLFVTAWTNDEVVPGVVSWPRWPTYLLFPVGFGLLVLRLLLQALQAGSAAIGLVPLPAMHTLDVPGIDE